MASNTKHASISNRLRHARSLLLFVAAAWISCRQTAQEITVRWTDGKATAVSLPTELAKGSKSDSLSQQLHIVNLADTSETPVLGSFTSAGGLVFEPLVPFSRGARYGVLVQAIKRGEFTIPYPGGEAAKIIASYPQADTVPENLLKIYLHFSRPMREGVSAKYVRMVSGSDTLQGTFLDLQPELWNEDRTVLTLWLDPGRIKRDLQPNLRMGAPLHRQRRYTLFVAQQWPDAQGRPLQTDHSRSFTTQNRDDDPPSVTRWTFQAPAANTADLLTIRFDKPLDHYLAGETLTVLDVSGKPVAGHFETFDADRAVRFQPAQRWQEGMYTLRADSKLEDLAGNNLNRPFDRDVTRTKQPSTQAYHTVSFRIGK